MPLTRRGFLTRSAASALAAVIVPALPSAPPAPPAFLPSAARVPRLAPLAAAVDRFVSFTLDRDVPYLLLTPPDRARLTPPRRLGPGDRVIVGDAATRWVLRGDLSREGGEPVVGVVIASTPIERFDFKGPADLVYDQQLAVCFHGAVVQTFLPAELTLVEGG